MEITTKPRSDAVQTGDQLFGSGGEMSLLLNLGMQKWDVASPYAGMEEGDIGAP